VIANEERGGKKINMVTKGIEEKQKHWQGLWKEHKYARERNIQKSHRLSAHGLCEHHPFVWLETHGLFSFPTVGYVAILSRAQQFEVRSLKNENYPRVRPGII